MTIIATWKHSGNNIAIASDSRLSGFGEHMDHCVKVFPIRLTIDGPVHQETNEQETLYSNSIGIAFCGNGINAYIIATAASILLSRVQTIPVFYEVSMDRITEFIKLLFEQIITSSYRMCGDYADTEIIIAGYCPTQKKLRAYKLFTVGFSEDKGFSHFLKTELLTCDGFYFSGSSKNEAYQIYQAQTRKNPLKVIREIIDSQKDTSIGGDIQFGDFNGQSFFVKGYQRPTMKNDRIQYAFAGIDVFDGRFSFGNTGFSVEIPCIAPFMEELVRDAFQKESS